MGIIQVPGRVSGKTYSLRIKGDTPSDTEQARIRAYLDEQEAAFAADYEATLGKPLAEPDDGTAIGRGVSRGAANIKSSLGTTLETIGQQTGIAGLAEYGRGVGDAAKQRLFDLSLQQPAPTTRQDVAAAEGFFPTIGKALTYAGEVAGEQVPQLGASLVGGGAGAIAGGVTGGVPGAIAGFGVGSGLVEAPMLFGANVQRQEEEVAAGRKDQVDLTDALASTVGQAGLTAVTNAMAGAGIFVRPGATLFTRAAMGAAVGGSTEALNEVGQQVLERYQAGLPIDSEDAIKEYIDAGLAGGILGVGAGGVGGAVGGPRVRAPAPEDVEAETPEAAAPLALPAPTLGLPAPPAGALPAPGTLEPLSATKTPDVVVTPPPVGAVRGTETSNIPPLSAGATATARSIGSDPQMLRAVEAIEAEGKATVKVIQDALGLSYPAANGIMRKLESVGAVSKYQQNKGRTLALPFKVSAIRDVQASVAAAASPDESAIETTPTDVPKATVTEAPKVAVPVANEAVAKAGVPAVDAPPDAPVPKHRLAAEAAAQAAAGAQIPPTSTLKAPEPKHREAAEATPTLQTWDTLKPGDKVTLYRGESQDNTQGGDWWTTNPEKAAQYGAVRSFTADALDVGRVAVQGHGGTDEFFFPEGVPPRFLAPTQEAPNVPEIAKAKPEEMGVGVPSGGPSVEGSGRADDVVRPPESVEAPAAVGLGGNLPVPDSVAEPKGVQPAALTGSPTEMQIRDAEKMIAPMRDVREVAANSAAQAELDATWSARMANKPELASLIEDYATPDALVADDPTTSEDKRKVLGLFQPGAVKKGKAGQAGAANAQAYFSRFKRPIDALEFIVADATLKNQRFKGEQALEAETGVLPAGDETISPVEREFFEGMTAARAKEALKWVEANMSPRAQAKVRDLQRKYRKAQEAKVPTRATSTLPSSTAIGGRVANADEKLEFEQELTAQAAEEAAKRAEAKILADAARTRMQGVEGLLSAVQEAKAPIQRRAAGMRKMTAEDQIDFVADQILGLKFNRPQEVTDLDTPLHPAAVNALRRGNLELALRSVQMHAPNDRIKNIVKALANFTRGTSVRVVSDLRDADGSPLAGLYSLVGGKSVISLDDVRGMTIDTLLHEMTHAATVREMLNKASPLRKRMDKIFAETAPMLSGLNGAKDVFEFVADAFSDPLFQNELARLYPKGGATSALGRIANEVLNLVRRLLGMQPTQPRNALDLTDQIVFEMLGFPVSLTELATPADEAVLLNRVAKVDGSFPGRTKEFAQQFGDDASRTLTGASWGAKRTVLGFMGMQPLADTAEYFNIDGARDLQNAVQQMDAAAIHSDNEVDGVLHTAQAWVKNNGNLKPLFDRVVTRSTINQVDPSLTRDVAVKKYGAGSDKLGMYDTMQKDWAAIGKDGRSLYTLMRTLYSKQYKRLREALEGKIDFILSENPELAAEVKRSIYTKFFDMNKIEPYFPLARKGDYWLEYSAFDPETGTTEPVRETYESPRARERAARELETMKGVTKGPDGKPITNFYTTLDFVQKGRTPDSLFVRDTLSIIRANLANTGVDAATTQSIQEEITRLFVDALPETSFAKSLQRRKNTRGYIEDSLEALRVKGYSLGRQGVRYAYSNKIRAVADAIAEQAKNTNDQNKVAVIEELVARANFATNPPSGMFERVVQTLNRTAFAFTLGFNVSSALVNLSSVPVVLYPYLSGRYGSKSSAAAIGNAYKLFLNSGLSREIELPSEFQGKGTTKVKSMPSIDNYFVLNGEGQYVLRTDLDPKLRAQLEELGPLVDIASKNGQLNRSIYYDSIGAEDVGRARNFGDRFAAISGAMFHQVERANRQVALVAAYKLELDRLRNKPTQAERGLTESQRRTHAAERAVYQATETGGGATLASAPRWAQKGIGRTALMFKNFGLSLFYMQMKLLKQLTLGSNDPNFTPEDRRVAFKQLMGLQLSSFALAGVAGVPLYGLVSTVADAFLGDDEEDADMLARRYLGEGVYKGFLTEMSGLDISARVGLTGLLMRENRYNTDPSAEETLVANLGGPAWSTATQIGRGVAEIYAAMTGEQGDMMRGIENMVPAWARNAMKAGRYLSDGGAIETRRKDVVTGDLGASDLVGQLLGFTPAKATLQQDINQLKVRIGNAVAKKRSDLSKMYYLALREGDIEGAQEALEDIRAFNAEIAAQYPDAVIDSEFLKSSLKSHQRTSAQSQNGVFVNPTVREGLADLQAMYNQGFQLF